MNQPGTISSIGSIEQVSDKFKKRELILEIPGQYPQLICFEAVQDRVALFDGLRPGQSINVHFNLNGRKANNGKVYNQLQVWKVE